MKIFSIIIVFLSAVLIVNPLLAGETFITETLPVENASPVIQLFALLRPEYFIKQTQGSNTWKSRLGIANYLSSGKDGGQSFFIDGETWTLKNTLQHQLSNENVLHITMPWKYHWAGFTDRTIYYFHEIFHLPQNGRTSNFHDRMKWLLRAEGNDIISFDNSVSGIGDLQLKYSWTPEKHQNTQFNAQLKLPTGNFDKQTGSENIDAGISVININPGWLKERTWLSKQALSFWYGAGLTLLGKVKQLSAYDPNRWSLSVRSGVAWQIKTNWQVKFQVDTNSPLFRSKIRELGWIPVQIGLATEHNVAPDISVDFMIVEDLRPRATPDIIFSTGLGIRF